MNDMRYGPEVVYEDGVPLIPNVSPVIILQGSDFEIGYQYSVQMYEIFGPWILERLRHELTDEETIGLRAYQAQIEKYAPEFIEQFKGRAAGAAACGVPISFEEFEMEMCRSLLGRFQMFPGEEPEGTEAIEFPSCKINARQEGCSGTAAWGSTTKDGKLICAGSGDHPISWVTTMIVIPDEGNSYVGPVVVPQTPGMHPAMNNKGLVHVHHGQGIYGEEKPGYGLPATMQLQHTLRFADNVEQALEIQLNYPKGQKASGLWVDTKGGNAVLESRYPRSIRHAGDYGEEDFLFATNNQLGKDLEKYASVGVGYSLGWPTTYYEHGGFNTDDLNSVRRNFEIYNAFHNYKGKVDLDFFKMLWRMPSKAIEAEDLKASEEEMMRSYGEGWDSYIGNLGICYMAIMEPDCGDEGRWHISLGAPGRHAQPLSVEYYFFPIDPLHTYVEIKLGKDAKDICLEAKKQVRFAQYDAKKALDKLFYKDVAYVAMLERFDASTVESQKGDYFLAKAEKAEGREQVRLYAKAARAFLRAQGYAKFVYESLVPQPESPEEMGLKPWFGDWGEWMSVDSCKPEEVEQ